MLCFNTRSNKRMEEEPVKSRQMMEEELIADKWDETRLVISSKKAEVCNLLTGFICHPDSHSFWDLVCVFVGVCCSLHSSLAFSSKFCLLSIAINLNMQQWRKLWRFKEINPYKEYAIITVIHYVWILPFTLIVYRITCCLVLQTWQTPDNTQNWIETYWY